MASETAVTGETARDWYDRLDEHPALETLLDTSDVDVSRDSFEEAGVHQESGAVSVTLYRGDDTPDYVRVVAEFDAETESLQWAKLDDGSLAAPLSGYGRIWRYEDGEVTSKRWMA